MEAETETMVGRHTEAVSSSKKRVDMVDQVDREVGLISRRQELTQLSRISTAEVTLEAGMEVTAVETVAETVIPRSKQLLLLNPTMEVEVANNSNMVDNKRQLLSQRISRPLSRTHHRSSRSSPTGTEAETVLGTSMAVVRPLSEDRLGHMAETAMEIEGALMVEAMETVNKPIGHSCR